MLMINLFKYGLNNSRVDNLAADFYKKPYPRRVVISNIELWMPY